MQDIWQKNNIKWSPKIHNIYFFYFLFLLSFKNSVFTQTTTKTFFVVKKLCLGVIKYVNWPQEFFCVEKILSDTYEQFWIMLLAFVYIRYLSGGTFESMEHPL